MNSYLIDTNVLSELTKPLPETHVEKFLRESKDRVFVGALLPISNRRATLEDWLDNEIMPWFADRVLPVTLTSAERCGDLAAISKTKGRPRPVVDTIIAATAITHDLVLATRNAKDYEDLGVTLLNPWDPAMLP